MNQFLTSIQYNAWVLPALLALPTVGAILVWIHGYLTRGGDERARDTAAMTARRVTFGVLVLEFVLSIGLWWSLDQKSTAWQAVFDKRDDRSGSSGTGRG